MGGRVATAVVDWSYWDHVSTWLDAVLWSMLIGSVNRKWLDAEWAVNGQLGG